MATRRAAHPAQFPAVWTAGAWPAMSPAPALLRLWTSTLTSVWTTSITAQQVIWLRLSKIALEGATVANQREVQRMVSEKVAAMGESANSLAKAGTALSSAVPDALSDPKKAQKLATASLQSANRAMRPFSTRVKANHKRLSSR